MSLVTTKRNSLVVRLCAPRGFCAGVDRAIQIVLTALKKYGTPVYVRHAIVHNAYVVEKLRSCGAVFIENLSEIPPRDQRRPVIFSAHGVPKSVLEDAKNRKLFYLDATCPLVSKVHKQAERHYRKGRHVILIGHAGHPEVIGTIGQLKRGAITLIETKEDAKQYLPQDFAKLGFVTQTTLSVEDTEGIIQILQERFPWIKAPVTESICYATTNRQQAVSIAAKGVDLFLIIGAPNSSNSRRLVEIAKNRGAAHALLVQRVSDLDWNSLAGLRIIGLSAGASAPENLIDEIVMAFQKRFDMTIEHIKTVQEQEIFPVNRELRNVILEQENLIFISGAG